MTIPIIPTLGSGIHVAFDGPGAERLLELGATNVVLAYDLLGIGPNRRDVLEHTRTRQVWFEDDEPYDDDRLYDHLYAAEVRWETPVVVWATPSLHDRLNLWRTCSWLHDQGIRRRDALIIDLPPRPRRPGARPRSEPFDCDDSVFYQSDEALQAHIAPARPWPHERYDQAVKLWEQYVSADPRRFAQRCFRGVPGFPELGPLWSFLSRFFPRMSAERTLRVSRYDEILLHALSTAWQTPVKVYIGDVIQRCGEFFSCAGDGAMAARLSGWARHGSIPAVESAPVPGDEDLPMRSHVYRLTERGMQLRAGLPELADAPRLPVGGAEAYAPEAPWVLLDDGRLVRR
jgi:hypothetical protein